MNFYLGPTLVSFRTDMVRKYQQSLIRDITLGDSKFDPTYKKDIYPGTGTMISNIA
ncbi:MAG: hypothetical protein HC831_09215 [Chloroflexia bacterium]|nr:hypothetical protein [Chloroflexia bacterium]